MLIKKVLSQFYLLPVKLFLSLKQNPSILIDEPKVILVIWTNTSFGFLLSSKSFFSALKNKYPSASITLITNKDVKQKFSVLKRTFTFTDFIDDIVSKSDFRLLIKTLRIKTDFSIVPVVEQFKFADHLLLRFVNAEIRIGVLQFNGKKNPYNFLFDRGIMLDFNKSPDVHITQILFEHLTQLSDFGEPGNIFQKIKTFNNKNIKNLKVKLELPEEKKVIVINFYTEKIENRLSTQKYVELVTKLLKHGNFQFYFIDDDNKYASTTVQKKLSKEKFFVENNNLRNLINLISVADLIITCDSEFMHVAGAFDIPQISLFGLSNPFNLAPVGSKKLFIKKSELIEEIETSDILEKAKLLLENTDKFN